MSQKTPARSAQGRFPTGLGSGRLWLTYSLVRREIAGRYRGSALGMLWSMLTPLFMLAVYTFVFGTVFQSRWGDQGEDASMGAFAITLFAGLIVFQSFSEVINQAPGLVIANKNYVKKVVFPLEIFPPVLLGSALFHMLVSLLVLFAFMLPVQGGIHFTALLLPLVIVPYGLVLLGIAWILSSLGTYLRDISQVTGPLSTAMLFLSPVFFPVAVLPEWLRPFVYLNPIAVPVEQLRKVALFGELPDFATLALYAIVGLLVAALGYLFFQKTRKGFADVV